jgi:glycerol kinase
LAIDQGTTSTRVLAITHNLKVIDQASRDHAQISHKPGWVEHDPEEIYNNIIDCLNEICLRNNLSRSNVKAIGIAN